MSKPSNPMLFDPRSSRSLCRAGPRMAIFLSVFVVLALSACTQIPAPHAAARPNPGADVLVSGDTPALGSKPTVPIAPATPGGKKDRQDCVRRAVTGSMIPRCDNSALPVTVIWVEPLRQQGITTAAGLVSQLPGNR